MEPVRRHVAGVAAIEDALSAGEPVAVLLVDRDDASESTRALVAHARERGAAIWLGGAGDLRRMSRGTSVAKAIAMLGPEPSAELSGLLARGGAVFLLHRAAYPSNVGFAIRTAEVSGAQGVIVDAAFNHEDRTRVSHVSMGADRLLPVVWASSERALELARTHGYRVIAIEDSGDRAPWDADLTGRVLLIAGNERDGVAPEVLARCDQVVRVPMAGFVPSYSLQAAITAVAVERLRQVFRAANGAD